MHPVSKVRQPKNLKYHYIVIDNIFGIDDKYKSVLRNDYNFNFDTMSFEKFMQFQNVFTDNSPLNRIANTINKNHKFIYFKNSLHNIPEDKLDNTMSQVCKEYICFNAVDDKSMTSGEFSNSLQVKVITTQDTYKAIDNLWNWIIKEELGVEI